MPRLPHSPPPLLNVRAALILGLSIIFGAGAGALLYWATGSVAQGVLSAGAVAASAIGLLNQIISDGATHE